MRSAPASVENRSLRFAAGMLPLLSFPVGDACYALEVSRADEVIVARQFVRVPQTSAWIRGLINRRGAIVPVVDLPRMLGLRDTIGAHESRVVVMVGGGRKVGLLVDGDCEVVYVSCERIEPYTAAVASETPYVAAVVPSESPPLRLIDLDELLNQFPYENGVGPKRIRTDQQE